MHAHVDQSRWTEFEKKKKEMIKLLQQPCSFYYPFSPKRFFH